MTIQRILKALCNPLVVLGLVFGTVAVGIVLPIFLSYRHTQSVIEQVEASGGEVRTESPEWCKRLPDSVSDQCAKLLRRITHVNADSPDDSLISALASCDTVREMFLGHFSDDGCSISDAGMRYLREFHHLVVLFIYAPQVTDAGIAHLSHCVELRHLGIRSPHVTDDALKHLSAMHHLKTLELVDCKIEGSGLQFLRQLTKVDNLTIRNAPLRDKHLAELSSFPILRALYLNDTTISDDGLIHIAAMERIAHLSLAHTQITDAGLAHLSSLRILGNLNLFQTDVSDKGVVGLVQDCEKLYALRLLGTNVSEETIQRLKSDHPKLHITW